MAKNVSDYVLAVKGYIPFIKHGSNIATVSIAVKPRRIPATKAEKERYARLKELGCIVTRLRRGVWAYPEIHHMTSGGRRLGNDKTIPLHEWFHRGIIPADCKTSSEATAKYGPSLAKDKHEFECAFGSEEYLLAETDKLLERM